MFPKFCIFLLTLYTRLAVFYTLYSHVWPEITCYKGLIKSLGPNMTLLMKIFNNTRMFTYGGNNTPVLILINHVLISMYTQCGSLCFDQRLLYWWQWAMLAANNKVPQIMVECDITYLPTIIFIYAVRAKIHSDRLVLYTYTMNTYIATITFPTFAHLG